MTYVLVGKDVSSSTCGTFAGEDTSQSTLRMKGEKSYLQDVWRIMDISKICQIKMKYKQDLLEKKEPVLVEGTLPVS